jgi:glycine cleavage system aminomethyltransferase T
MRFRHPRDRAVIHDEAVLAQQHRVAGPADRQRPERIGADPLDEGLMTASTANAAKVMQHLEFCRQWLWPELDVQIASVSEQWAQYADDEAVLAQQHRVAGPADRQRPERIGADPLDEGQRVGALDVDLAEEADWLETVKREVNTVRSRVGVCDVTTLGKIDIQGPDALAFIERVCANPFGSLPVGSLTVSSQSASPALGK